MMEDAEIWTNALIDLVPINRLAEVWAVAVERKTGDFAPNFFDVKNAWGAIVAAEKKAEAERRAEDPIARCTQAKNHRSDKGEILAQNPYLDDKAPDQLMPCPHCRPDDLTAWRRHQKALYGEIKRPLFTPKMAVDDILAPSEEVLTLEAANALRDRYNDLVEALVGPDARKAKLFVVFDEGGNVFRYPHRVDVMFSAAVLRKKIEGYEKALEAREEGKQ